MYERHRARGLLIVIIAAVAANALAGNGCGPQETDMTSITQFNVTRFGDGQARSYLPVTGRLGAEIAWSRETTDTVHQQPPLHLALHEDQLLVHYPELLQSRLAASGAVQWSQPVTPNFEFQMTTGGLATMDVDGQYTVYGFDGRELVSETLPLLAELVRLFYSETVPGEIRYAFSIETMPDSDPDEADDPEGAAYHRFNTTEIDYYWRFKDDDTLLQVLRNEAGTVLSLVASRGIHSFAPDATDDAQVTTYAAEFIEAAARDFDDHLLVVLHDEGQRLLRCLDPAGATLWDVPLPDGVIMQPPASAPGGHVYLLVGSQLLHVEAGKVIWSYEIPFSGEYRSLFTVLSDRTVLLTAGTHCIQLREDGEELVRVDTGSQLASRPLMDPAGRVYLGAGPWIRCYH